jgi:uracil-DNA glycosylase
MAGPRKTHPGTAALDGLAGEIRQCRLCLDMPRGQPLPHQPRPVFRVSVTARIAICGQAPGTRVHASGTPFTDPSGDRLRTWMAVTPDEFYDVARVAIIPMGFCFPGLDAKGGDRPPRRECASAWHARLFAAMPQLDLLLLVGSCAQAWHLPQQAKRSLSDSVADWRVASQIGPSRTHAAVVAFPLPHPSWRNNAWLKARPWFDDDLLPGLRREVRARL